MASKFSKTEHNFALQDI